MPMTAAADDTATRLGARVDAIASWREMATDRFNVAVFAASCLSLPIVIREEVLHPGEATLTEALGTTLLSGIILAMRGRVSATVRMACLYAVVAGALTMMMNRYGFADPIPFVAAGTMTAIAGVLMPLRMSLLTLAGYVGLVAATGARFVMLRPQIVGRTDIYDVDNWVRVAAIFVVTSAGGLWAVSRFAAWLAIALRVNEQARVALNSATAARLQHVERERELEEELRRARVQGSLEMLAGGVAKDFQSLLQVSIRGASLAATELHSADREAALELVRKAGRQGTALADRLLEYSRGSSAEQHWLDPNDVLTESLPLIQQLVPPNVELRFVRGASLGRMLAAPGQLDQLLLNLCTEARDWMPMGGVLRMGIHGTDTPANDVVFTAVATAIATLRERRATGSTGDTPTRLDPDVTLSQGLRQLVSQLGGSVVVRALSSREREVVVTLPRGSLPPIEPAAPRETNQ